MRNTLITPAALLRENGHLLPAPGLGRHRPPVPRHRRRAWWMRLLHSRTGKR